MSDIFKDLLAFDAEQDNRKEAEIAALRAENEQYRWFIQCVLETAKVSGWHNIEKAAKELLK